MKRVAIYVRVSTEDQSENGTSLDTQLAACRKYAQANGWQVTAELREQGVSGATLCRPQLDKLRDLVADGLVDIIVIFKLDRLSRDTGQTLALLKEFQKHNVLLRSATTQIEDSPEGKLMLTMLAAMADFERTQIMERTRRGKEARTRQGFVVGTLAAPFGFCYIVGQGKYELDEAAAEIVKQIFGDIVTRQFSLNEIARRLNERHITAPGGGLTWHKSTIKRILQNPVYTGRLVYGRTKSVTGLNKRTPNRNIEVKTKQARPQSEWIVVENIVTRLVSDETFDAVGARLARNAVLSKRRCAHAYLLRGHVKCGYCSGTLRGHVNNGVRQYECYRRQDRDNGGNPEAQPCPSKSYNADRLEQLVWTALAEHITNPALLRRIADEREPSSTIEEKEQAQIETLQTAKAKVEAQGDLLLDLYIRGGVSKEKYEQKSKPLNSETERLDREIGTIQLQAALRELFLLPKDPYLEILCKHMRHAVQTFGFEEKRRLLELSNIKITATADAIHIDGTFTTDLLNVNIEADLINPSTAVRKPRGENVEASTDQSEGDIGENGDLINPLSITYGDGDAGEG